MVSIKYAELQIIKLPRKPGNLTHHVLIWKDEMRLHQQTTITNDPKFKLFLQRNLNIKLRIEAPIFADLVFMSPGYLKLDIWSPHIYYSTIFYSKNLCISMPARFDSPITLVRSFLFANGKYELYSVAAKGVKLVENVKVPLRKGEGGKVAAGIASHVLSSAERGLCSRCCCARAPCARS